MEKRYLFTPGPTPVPPEVLAAMAEPMVHHRGVDFREVYERTLVRLQAVFRTESQVLLFSASGTGAMESAVTNLAGPGDRVAVVVAGAFGERWVAICKHHGLDVQRIDYGWGEVPVPERGRRCGRRERGRSSCSARSPRPRPASSPTCRRSRPPSATRCSWSTPSPRSALSRSRPTRGPSTSSSPARRRRSCAHRAWRWRASPTRCGTACRRRGASTSTGARRGRRRRRSTRRSRPPSR